VESIGAWLERLGLQQYQSRFEDNAVDLEVAAMLTDADLKELGVVALGHRKRLLKAIAGLRRGSHSAAVSDRRQLTVMFCDLVGSTALSVRLDPEDMASLIGVYQQCCTEAIERFDGFVARYVGDGVLAYFGYPQAHEDDAERAVHAALALIKDIERTATRGLAIRIGIATGPVVVGDFSGVGVGERDVVVGEAPNLAARLQTVAVPGTVVISATTQRLVANIFDCAQLAPLVLQGFNEPVRAWSVRGKRAFISRFEARRAVGLTAFMGRGREIEVLCECWRSAEAGQGQVVLITGEPGIGKSRLYQELGNRIAASPYSRFDCFGSPYHKNSPLAPIIARLEHDCGISDDDTPQRRRVKLDAFLAQIPDMPPSAAPVLASLLSLPADPQDAPLDPDPIRRKHLTLETLADLLARQASVRPLLFGGEDIQWFDPTSRELLDILVERAASWRGLIVLTSRPDFAPPWSARAGLTRLALERLSRDVAVAIIDSVTGDVPLARNIWERIIERTDGVPLFIEELTKAVIESEATSTATHSPAIPDTLQASLMARLDQAAPIKEVAQIGAAIGREFPEALIEAVAPVGRTVLRATLDQLCAADLLQTRTTPSGETYVFKHALIQDAAYESMLHARRKEVHRRIVETLETRFPDAHGSQPEIRAQHWERAEAFDQAIRCWKLAGEHAVRRSATLEADAHLRQALALIERLQPGGDRDVIELELSVNHGAVLRAAQGPPGLGTGRAFGRARDLCRETGDSRHLLPALAGLYGYHLVRAENGPAAEVARELLDLAEARQDRIQLMIGHRAVGMVDLHKGDLMSARTHLELALEHYDEANDGRLAFIYGTDHAQTIASFLSMTLWLLGEPEKAAAREAWAVAHGAKVDHLYSQIQTSMFRIIVRGLAHDWATVEELGRKTLEVALRHSFGLTITLCRFYLAAARVLGRGHWDDIDAMQRAADTWGPINYRPLYLGLVADAMGRAGRRDEALRVLDEAHTLAEATDERWFEAELHRLRGELMLTHGDAGIDHVVASYNDALAIARRQAARSLELRSAVSLARLLKSNRRLDEAHAVLAPLSDHFGEGRHDVDFASARHLVGELAAARQVGTANMRKVPRSAHS
jgi:class 3 adenylate cyclase/predicted ATPase